MNSQDVCYVQSIIDDFWTIFTMPVSMMPFTTDCSIWVDFTLEWTKLFRCDVFINRGEISFLGERGWARNGGSFKNKRSYSETPNQMFESSSSKPDPLPPRIWSEQRYQKNRLSTTR